MPSFLTIPGPGTLLASYLDPTHAFAWPLYDEDPAPDDLSGADLTAPALLSYPIRLDYLNEMGRQGTPYCELVQRMREFIAATDRVDFDFADLAPNVMRSFVKRHRGELAAGPEPWQKFVVCLDAVQECEGLTSVAVTKILHRKRPRLVPINDSYVREFYGIRRGYVPLFKKLWDDLRTSTVRARIQHLISQHTDLRLTELRVLDIVVWMHQATARRLLLGQQPPTKSRRAASTSRSGARKRSSSSTAPPP